MSSLHWHIEVEPWVLLHPILRQDVWNAVTHIDGIRQVNDMEVISPQTLERWMLPREQALDTSRTRKRDTNHVRPTQPHDLRRPEHD